MRTIGRDRIGILFDVEAVSIETIYLNTLEDQWRQAEVRVSMNASVAVSGEHLLVGSVPLLDLTVPVLKDYRAQTENIDQLYHK